MRITRCVPLAGPGVIARFGGLVAVTNGRGPDPDPLLSVLAEVAAAAGDGGDLVLLAARAALGRYRQLAGACAGVAADGGVAVLVHGRALATVRVDGGPEVTLTASDSVTPVSRTFTGAAVTVGLAIGDPPAPDPRFWLGGGVVRGGGLAVTLSADVAGLAVRDAIDVMAGVPKAGATINSDDWAKRRPPADPVGWHPPTVDTPAFSAPPVGPPVGAIAGEDGPQAVFVDGVLCAGDHFNDPGARACRQCGIGLNQPPRNFQRRQRPLLGVLVLDDGTRFPLDRDYVLGREPAFDSDVIEGRARALRINDPNGTVSRLHLRISLVGWQVEVSDLGSANGSVLQSPGDERTLTPYAATMIEPGTRIGIGHRSMQYLAYQGVLP